MNIKNPVKYCVIGTGLFTVYSAASTAIGAASGAIGWSVLRAAGWKDVEFNYIHMVQANAVGNAFLSPIGFLGYACNNLAILSSSDDSEEKKSNNGLAGQLVWAGVSGALSAMLGAWSLNLLKTEEQTGFAAASGATGTAILAGGLAVVSCCCVCVGGACYLLAHSGPQKQVKLVKVPTPPANAADGTIIGLDGARIVTEEEQKELGLAEISVANVSALAGQNLQVVVDNPDGAGTNVAQQQKVLPKPPGLCGD